MQFFSIPYGNERFEAPRRGDLEFAAQAAVRGRTTSPSQHATDVTPIFCGSFHSLQLAVQGVI
jgi:hypothetical protein